MESGPKAGAAESSWLHSGNVTACFKRQIMYLTKSNENHEDVQREFQKLNII